MKYYPAFCLTILSPLREFSDGGSINFVLNVTNQLHKMLSVILTKRSSGQLCSAERRVGIRRLQGNKTTFARGGEKSFMVDIGKEKERKGKQETCDSCHSLKL